jgi:hypothetical protein
VSVPDEWARTNKHLIAAVQREDLMLRFLDWLHWARGRTGTPDGHRFRPTLDVLGTTNPSPGRPRPAVRPAAEHLEARLVPALPVTYHGGSVISHVDLETVYYGQDWTTGYNWLDQAGLDQFASTIAQSSYLAMLGEYGVGLGHFSQHDLVTNSLSPANGATVSDAGIQAMLTAEIRAGNLHESTGQQVYLVYLPPGVHSQFDESRQALAHHGSFTMTFPHVASGWDPVTGTRFWYVRYSTDTVPYAVIPYPSTNPAWAIPEAGAIPWGFDDFQKQTEVTSHELAEALTNPAQGGWWGDNLPAAANEIGDIANLHWTYLDGYVVQREWSNYFGRNIAPQMETWGNLVGAVGILGGGPTSSGSARGYYFSTTSYPLQYTWYLPDGNYSWFMPDRE